MVFNGSGMKMRRRWVCYICNLKGVGWSKRKEIVVTIRAMCREKSSKKYKEVWCDFDRASSLICGNKMPTRCNRGFYCRSYCLLNMFWAPLCTSSGAQEYYTVVAACGISCCGFQVAGLVWSWGLCVRFAGCLLVKQRFLLQILLLAQHVSGTTVPIIRSSRVLYSGCCLWYFVLWFSSC